VPAPSECGKNLSTRSRRKQVFRRLWLEGLEGRHLLSASPIFGRTGDVVPIDLTQVIPGTRDFGLIGFDYCADQSASNCSA
jgi:hypothetical protein